MNEFLRCQRQEWLCRLTTTTRHRVNLSVTIVPKRARSSSVVYSAAAEAPAGRSEEATTSRQPQPLTPRQRRLAQQRRRWEEAQLGQQHPQQQHPQQQHPQQQHPQQQHPQQQHPQQHERAASQVSQQHAPATKTKALRGSSPPSSTSAAAASATPATASAGAAVAGVPANAASKRPRAGSSAHPASAVAARPATPSTPAPLDASRTTSPSAPRPSAASTNGLGKAKPRANANANAIAAAASPSPSPTQEQVPAWPSLFANGPLHFNPSTSTSASTTADLRSLSGPLLVSLAHHWVQELVDCDPAVAGSLRAHTPTQAAGSSAAPGAAAGSPPQSQRSPSPAGRPQAAGGAAGAGRSGSAGPSAQAAAAAAAGAGSGGGTTAKMLPEAATRRLLELTAAVDAHVARGSLGHQEVADLAWCVAHYDRAHALGRLYPAMSMPFNVVPSFMPQLRLEDFMSEVELRRDVIYLDAGTRAVEESRLTGWQSEIGATFRYSGKEMQPQTGGLSPEVLQVRDALWALTGVKYDSVLINYYVDGKCGMRYHVDPLYDRWTPNSAVVSLGDTRTFIFRSIEDHSKRWQYRVRNGDVVLMFGDCQDRLQHCVRVERRAQDAGPRMSLVFKERLRGPDGEYVLP